jgi:hypothetical protein
MNAPQRRRAVPGRRPGGRFRHAHVRQQQRHRLIDAGGIAPEEAERLVEEIEVFRLEEMIKAYRE